MKEVAWTKRILETFIDEAMLTEDEEKIMRTRVKGWTIAKQSLEFGLSESAISKMIQRLKIKYDNVQKYNDTLPPRKNNVKETYK